MKLTRVLVPSVRASPAAGKAAERLGFSPALRASVALRMRPMHVPPEQLSPVVVALPSSHVRALPRCSQPTGGGELTSVVQRLASSQVVMPQTFATPPPPQVCGAVQAPQVSVPPQPSGIVPQFFPCAAQVVGVQAPPTFAVPPPRQVSGAPQTPQVSVPPQPSGIVPQFFPCAAQVVGVQVPQTFAVPPPPQVSGAVQTPQVSVPPQPSGIVPQFFPCAAQVVGVQTGTLVIVPCQRVWCLTPPTVQVTCKLTALPAATVPGAMKSTEVVRTSGLLPCATPFATVAVPEMPPTVMAPPAQPAG